MSGKINGANSLALCPQVCHDIFRVSLYVYPIQVLIIDDKSAGMADLWASGMIGREIGHSSHWERLKTQWISKVA